MGCSSSRSADAPAGKRRSSARGASFAATSPALTTTRRSSHDWDVLGRLDHIPTDDPTLTMPHNYSSTDYLATNNTAPTATAYAHADGGSASRSAEFIPHGGGATSAASQQLSNTSNPLIAALANDDVELHSTSAADVMLGDLLCLTGTGHTGAALPPPPPGSLSRSDIVLRRSAAAPSPGTLQHQQHHHQQHPAAAPPPPRPRPSHGGRRTLRIINNLPSAATAAPASGPGQASSQSPAALSGVPSRRTGQRMRRHAPPTILSTK